MLLWEAVGGKKVPKQGVPTKVQPISTRLRGMQANDRCEAMTRSGRRCRCRKATESKFCNFHDPEISARIRERARQKRAERQAALAGLPTEYMKSLGSVDGIIGALDGLFREVRLGVVSPRTAGIMLSIIDRLMIYDKLVSEGAKRRVSKRLRAHEVRSQLAAVIEEMKLPAPQRQVKQVAATASPAPVQRRIAQHTPS
ncbi:MAG TPA: hypothetical protein P5572_14065 [Phycisphaerae bacterium]|nr:hypothetical protein [Phycisphaerae bacterium]